MVKNEGVVSHLYLGLDLFICPCSVFYCLSELEHSRFLPTSGALDDQTVQRFFISLSFYAEDRVRLLLRGFDDCGHGVKQRSARAIDHCFLLHCSTMAHNIPRFSNPYLLPESSQSVSRKRLRTDSEDEHEDAEPFEEDLLQNLHQHLSSIEWDTSAPVRHCEEKAAPESSELGAFACKIPSERVLTCVVFRLWSTSAAPQSIKLSNQVVLTKSIP